MFPQTMKEVRLLSYPTWSQATWPTHTSNGAETGVTMRFGMPRLRSWLSASEPLAAP
jgi:hypothetical protein